MARTRCPVCRCQRFYVKNPEDEYEVCEFDCVDGQPVFAPDGDDDPRPDIDDKTETFCNQCAWHGPFGDLAE